MARVYLIGTCTARGITASVSKNEGKARREKEGDVDIGEGVFGCVWKLMHACTYCTPLIIRDAIRLPQNPLCAFCFLWA